MGVVQMRGPAGSKRCNMTGLPKGDCNMDVERTATGQHTEFCMYHNKLVNGLTTPVRREGYGNRIPPEQKVVGRVRHRYNGTSSKRAGARS